MSAMFDREDMRASVEPTADQIERMVIQVAETQDHARFTSVVMGKVDGCVWLLHAAESRTSQIDALREHFAALQQSVSRGTP